MGAATLHCSLQRKVGPGRKRGVVEDHPATARHRDTCDLSSPSPPHPRPDSGTNQTDNPAISSTIHLESSHRDLRKLSAIGEGVVVSPFTSLKLTVDYYPSASTIRIVLAGNFTGPEITALLAPSGANSARSSPIGTPCRTR